jgi:peptide/nickel transport system permease protein
VLSYIVRRVLLAVPTIIAISVIAFIVIELPPGDYASTYVMRQQWAGREVTPEMEEVLRHRWGLDRPAYVRYFFWVRNFVTGDFGQSHDLGVPVRDVLLSRLAGTMLVTVAALLFSWLTAFPIGLYSALRQYSAGDYFWTFAGFLGLSIPNFLLALVLMFVSFRYLGAGIGGLFSAEYQEAPWSLAKVFDLLQHLWIPVVVVGTAGTASLIRILRANLLDELKKPYVEAARARGLNEIRLVIKYPLRIAVNPFVSSIGWVLPSLISGAVITAVVLDLPTAGPIFLQALRSEDMALAGAFVVLIGVMTVAGILISDIILAILDPRIRYE